MPEQEVGSDNMVRDYSVYCKFLKVEVFIQKPSARVSTCVRCGDAPQTVMVSEKEKRIVDCETRKNIIDGLYLGQE